MPEGGNALSRNPNICASCSSMEDGLDEPNVPELGGGSKASKVPETPKIYGDRKRSGC
jgi:hypothetical protein